MEIHWDLLARVGVGTALAGIIGYERDLHGRPAGLRTHMLVGLASAMFMVVSTHFVYWQGYHREDLVAVDPSRIAASVVTGIGFLAGGAILRTGLSVQGLTTAAGLWLVAAIGLSAGAGMYPLSIAGTTIGVIALTVLRRFEDKDNRAIRRRVSVVLTGTEQPPSSVLHAVESLGAQVTQTEYEREVAQGRTSLVFHVRYGSALSHETLLHTLESLPGVQRVRVEPLG